MRLPPKPFTNKTTTDKTDFHVIPEGMLSFERLLQRQ